MRDMKSNVILRVGLMLCLDTSGLSHVIRGIFMKRLGMKPRRTSLSIDTCLNRRWLALSAILLSVNGSYAGEGNLSIFPEASDPVLGERAAIVEWAWSPAYAKRFGVEAQKDGLKDGPLWLIGVKILRAQDGNYQSYRCHIAGLIDNKLPILMPPGDRFFYHPAYRWIGGLPRPKGPSYVGPALNEQNSFVPGQESWRRNPVNQAQRDKPEAGIGTPYLLFHRYYTPELAYFELEGSCGFLGDPEILRNEVRFPSRADTARRGMADVWGASAIAFDIPDRVMKRIYPYTLKASDWRGCLMRRAGDKTIALTKQKLARLNTTCEPVESNTSRR